MKSKRPELDGQRLVDDENTRLWLVFNGLRHHITSAEVYDLLFRADLTNDRVPDLESIAEGPDLGAGTRLVSNEETGNIFLVFGAPAINIRKHLIESHDNFVTLGFSDALVRPVPAILLAAIPSGQAIRF